MQRCARTASSTIWKCRLPEARWTASSPSTAAAFGWSFTDYGPSYSAFEEGLDGGFDAQTAAETKPLPVLYSDDLERSVEAVEEAGGRIVRPIFTFPGGRRFHFTDPAGNELAVWTEKGA